MSSVRSNHTWWTCTPRERTIMQRLIKEGTQFLQTTDELLYTFNVSVPETFSDTMSDWADWTNIELIHLLAEGMKEEGIVTTGQQYRPLDTESWRAADYALALIERTTKGFQMTRLEDLIGGVVINEASVERRTLEQVPSYRPTAEVARHGEMAPSGPGPDSVLNTPSQAVPRSVAGGGIAHPPAVFGVLPTRSYNFRSTPARRHATSGLPCADRSLRDNLEDLSLEEGDSTSNK
ncbi:uncharacterized protein DNG_05542 [Cephalotrichum gorgonifer]|uniref:Uncharacterized protein n=1 Tax=Cephalotrichum gorgonifer TaxID=2041049 RepID=A0AAE8SVJ9_9PEZI|nr:uncharacterized protein DNG_05542 [Cephalotrichum gorgonifer]